jgi:hypothetical protein
LHPFSQLGKRGVSIKNKKMSNMKEYADLVDIRDVSIDKTLSKQERIAEYVRQIKDPYHFKCGKFTVTARFAENGISLEDCLHGLMA